MEERFRMNHIALLLRPIYLNKLSGQLSFRRGPIHKRLFFLEGELVSAKTNVPEERLGEILFKLGKISGDARDKLGRYIEPNQPLGKTLSQKGVTSQRNVDDGLTYQMREIALSLFPFFDAEIGFQESPVGDQERAVMVNIPYLLEDGVRRMKYDAALRDYLAKRAPAPKGHEFVHLLTEEEKQLRQIIKGGVPCETLWRSHKYNPEFFWKTVYLLYCLNIIDFEDEEEKLAADDHRQPPSNAPGPAPEPPTLEEQVKEVLAFRERLPELNYYQILDVPKTASEDEIKKAYFHLARRFHPDRFDRSLPANYRAQIEDVFDRITKAYRTLTSHEGRRDYNGKMTTAGDEKPKDTLVRADTKFRQAKTLFSQGRFEDAMGLLEEVVRLNKNKGGYYLLLAMTETRLLEYQKKAEEHFLKAIELEPWNPEGFVGLGMLYKKVGLTTKATRQFKKALELDGEHEGALRELAELTKKERKPGLKGLLNMNIFGSKKK
jgi:tetratricopeptide (TPR) repeat protein